MERALTPSRIRPQAVRLGSLALAAVALLPGCKRDTDDASFARLMNLGKAYLENRDSKNALDVLTQAVALQPQSAPALRNLARAQRLAKKFPEALTSLDRAAKAEPQSVATSYLTGLVRTSMGQFAEASPQFEEAVRLDPNEATLRFQLAAAYEALGRRDKAREQLNEAVRLDPLHASAHFKLAGLARQEGNREETERRQREFIRLRSLFGDETRSGEALELCVYTQPEAVVIDKPKIAEPGPPIPVHFTPVVPFASEADARASACCVLDVLENGAPRLLSVSADGLRLLTGTSTGTFELAAVDAPTPGAVDDCVVGNFFDNVPPGEKYDPKVHAANDVLLLGRDGVRLLERTAQAVFEDVTEASGLNGVVARAAVWVDYEHDGDLDLFLARESGAELWQNNGNATFTNVTADVGLADGAPRSGAVDVLAVDLDENVAVDLIVAYGDGPTDVYMNQRAGRFAKQPEPPGPWPPAKLLLASDLNQDGHADVVLVRDGQAEVIYGRSATRGRIELPGTTPAAAKLLDLDNDSRLDLVVTGSAATDSKPQIQLFRNAEGSVWSDVSASTGLAGLELAAASQVTPADIDLDGDTDLALQTGHTLRALRNDGGNANRQLKLRLSTVKTNTTGLGTRIELRDADWHVTRLVTGLPIEIGVGQHAKLDSLLTVWTNGVVDNQVNVTPTSEPITLVEKNVATGSCPFLYAWDGERFRFVTDLLGNSPIGLPLSREILLPADPDEIVEIGDAATFPPRDGAYTVVITDEFREVLYLDRAELIAVDHPADIELHPTDKLMPAPFPESQVWAMRNPRELRSALGDDGLDRTDAVRAIDDVYAPPGLLLPAPYRGMTHPLAVTLDFGPLDADKPLVLALTGWLQYGDGSTNIALSQNPALTIIPPRLDVETADGQWLPVDITVGMPAGKTKTALCDLAGRLPTGARRLRLTTTFEIRWDRIALLERADLPGGDVHRLRPTAADLQWRGFSEIKQRVPEGPTTPDFDIVAQRPPWRTVLSGWCTRYGDALELVTELDDRLALVNSGDALTVGFDAASLPPPPPDLRRTFFLYTVGWDKDGDPNVVDGETVEPLPTALPAEPSAGLPGWPDDGDWQVRFNQRFVPRDRFAQ